MSSDLKKVKSKIDKEIFSSEFSKYIGNLLKYDKLDRDTVNRMKVKDEHLLKGSPSIHALNAIEYKTRLDMKVNIYSK